MIRSLLPTLIVLFLFGCTQEKPTLPAEKLAAGVGTQWWLIRAPSDIKPEDYAGIGYIKHDGTIKTLSTSDGWKPNEEAYVFIGDLTKEFRPAWIRLVRDGGITLHVLDYSDFKDMSFGLLSSQEEAYEFGEIFAKMGMKKEAESFSGGDFLFEGQLGIAVIKIDK